MFTLLLICAFFSLINSKDAILWAKPRVALLDTGCKLENVKGVSFTQESPFVDNAGHGTLMSKIILGTNPNIELIMVKVAEHSHDFDAGRIVRGLYWCLDNNVDVVNLSFTIDKNTSVSSAIDELVNNGITVIAAVGNRNTSTGFVVKNDFVYRASTCLTTPGFPANMDSVIGVGAINFWGNRADFARSVGEFSTDGKSFLQKGTSISSARLTGLVSLIIGRYPNLNPKQVRGILHNIAEKKKNHRYLSRNQVNSVLKTNLLAYCEFKPEITLAQR
ncbi:S8 family serine peptidase [bacterium]|nr:S8 family serine peptidase [bacterium]